MTTALQRARARLRQAARLGAQLAELMDFLGFAFLAQLARALLFAALALLLLLDLLARVTLRLTVLTVRFLGVRLWRLLRASTALWVWVLVVMCFDAPASIQLEFENTAKYGHFSLESPFYAAIVGAAFNFTPQRLTPCHLRV